MARLTIALALGAVASLVLLFASSFLVVDSDLFHEMALARAALARGAIPADDLFSYTPTVSPSVHHEWGTGMLLYGVVRLAGARGLVLFKYLLFLALFARLGYVARLQKVSWETWCLLAPVGILLADVGFSNIRAQAFSMVFLSALLVLLQWDRAGGRRWPFVWLPVYVIWLNLHAGFVVGVILLGCYCLEGWLRHREWRRHVLLTGAAMIPLLLVNPYGLDYVRYLGGALLMERPLIQEWQPLWAAPSLLAIFALSLVPALYAWRRRGLAQLPGALALLLFALAAGRHVRHLSLYAVVWMGTVPAWFDATALATELRDLLRANRRVVAALCAVLMVGALAGTMLQDPLRLRIPVVDDGSSPVVYPAGAVEYLREQDFRGNVMTPFVAGSFVLWKLHPQVRVALDGRYEVAYRPGVTEEILDFYAGRPGWRATLQRYPTDRVLVPAGATVQGLLEADPAWKTVYRDDAFLLYAPARSPAPVRDLRGRTPPARFP